MNPFFSASFLNSSICILEFISLVFPIIPTVLAFGAKSFISVIAFETGIKSEVPVTFPSGLSGFFTKPASTGSVTAVNSIGISFVALKAACADGVEIANIKSFLSDANELAIV